MTFAESEFDIRATYLRISAARQFFNRSRCPGRNMFFNMGANQFNNFIGILVRYQTTGDFGMGCTGNHGFDALSLKADQMPFTSRVGRIQARS